MYSDYLYTVIQNRENGGRKMHGSCRVVTFCLLTTVLPTILIIIPLYLRNMRYADVMYKISDSDVIQIHKGQSSIFCKSHSLMMDTPFNAFQMSGRPELSPDIKKHIRLNKSLTLPDDTLDYWGFYLFKGASVKLNGCSRYEGAKILVVKGDKILNTCGILEGNKYTIDPRKVDKQGHVVVTLESPGTKKENFTAPTFTKLEDKDNYKEKNNSDTENSQDEDNSMERLESGIENLEDRFVQKNSSIKLLTKRDTQNIPVHQPNTVLDAGIHHGGNAFNATNRDQDSSVSSFEVSLHECYHNNYIVNEPFPFSILCNSTKYLEKTTSLKVTYDIPEDGYYYYIFYSDNDIVLNDIHVTFDIFKPKLEYANMSSSKVCLNKTECVFDVGFFSNELVIVEVPTTTDKLRNDDDTLILTSVCHPRMSIYIFFPVTVLLLILLFAFL